MIKPQRNMSETKQRSVQFGERVQKLLDEEFPDVTVIMASFSSSEEGLDMRATSGGATASVEAVLQATDLLHREVFDNAIANHPESARAYMNRKIAGMMERLGGVFEETPTKH